MYSSFASLVYGFEVNKKDHPVERFAGKTAILGLGYNMGGEKFCNTYNLQRRNMTPMPPEMSEGDATRIVSVYRGRYPEIPATWRFLGEVIPRMTHADCDIEWGPVRFVHEAVILPNGLKLHYRKLAYSNNEWTYFYGKEKKKLFGGKLLENIVQALARIIIFDAAMRIRPRAKLLDVQLAMQVHDELVYVVPEEVSNVIKKIVEEEMSKPPKWAPELPLAAEGHVGVSYGDAK